MSSEYGLKEKKQAKVQWMRILKDALDADTWGQSIEATEEYEKLSRILEQQIPDLHLTAEERGTLLKVKHCIDLRTHTLQGQEAAVQGGVSQAPQHLKLEDVKLVQSVMDDLFVRNVQSFPLQLNGYRGNVEKKESNDMTITHDDNLVQAARGSLLPPPKVKNGLTTISITIDKIGLKDAESYIGSHLTVSVADSHGNVLESQDTPKSNNLRPNYVMFGCTVHIQTSLEEIQNKNLCLFFEFKHYKPKKKKISTRCFALMEKDEVNRVHLQNGVACLELYKKPTDFSRSSLSLFTIKQLYLHIQVTFNKH